MLDLWNVYKSVYLRASKARETSRHEAAENAAVALRLVVEKPSQAATRRFMKAERVFLDHPCTTAASRAFGPQVLEAVRSGEYVCNKPQIKTFALQGEDARPGIVYVAHSNRRPGELKLGYTTLKPAKRAQLFRDKYGYSHFEVVAHARTAEPSRLESLVQAQLRSVRIQGSTKGDSNEWYRCSVAHAQSLIENTARQHGLALETRSWA